MKLKLILISFPVALLLTACPEKDKTKSLFKDDCPLSYKIEWTIVEKGVSVDKQIQLLSTISAAAKADADKVGSLINKASGEVKLDNQFQLKKVLQSDEIRKAQVSQDVFDEFIRTRTASCNIWDGIKNGIYGNDDQALKEARNLFTSISANFANLEKKKSQ